MCGIVGAVTQRNVYKILIEGLHRLEYRGYDSAGLSMIDQESKLQTRKNIGKVAELEAVAEKTPLRAILVLHILAGPLMVSPVH